MSLSKFGANPPVLLKRSHRQAKVPRAVQSACGLTFGVLPLPAAGSWQSSQYVFRSFDPAEVLDTEPSSR